jgi:hypothetical protein
MDELVKKLSEGTHPVELSLRPERSAAALKRRIDEYAYVHVKFTETRGGTELGVTLDNDKCDYSAADFDAGTGKVHLHGHLTLNFVPVKCVADIELGTLQGAGHLIVAEPAESAPATS